MVAALIRKTICICARLLIFLSAHRSSVGTASAIVLHRSSRHRPYGFYPALLERSARRGGTRKN